MLVARTEKDTVETILPTLDHLFDSLEATRSQQAGVIVVSACHSWK